MFFKKKGDDLKNIKEAIEGKEPEGMEIIPLENYQEYEEENPSLPREMAAPLFVKIDKYRDVLQSVNEMKLFVSGTKKIFGVLQELEDIRNDSLKIMRATVQRLEKTLTEIDTELLRPRGVNMDISPVGEMAHIEESLNDLQKQLVGMKKDLQELK